MRGSTRRTLSIIGLLYVVEGFPMGVFAKVVPVFLRRQELSTTEIGLLSTLGLAWSFKVLWSPLVDRIGALRTWIVGALGVMTLCLGVLGAGDPLSLGVVMWLLLGAYCLASATQDIAIDAYTIATTERGSEGPVNSIRATAYRIGLIASGGGLLFLPRWIDWSGTFAVAALASGAMALAVLACPHAPVPASARRETFPALGRWLSRPGVVPVALFILLFRIGDRAMGPMIEPFWVDRGFANEEIALVSNTFGLLATIAGAVAGGAIVSRFGIPRSLFALGVLALVSNLGYAAAAATPESRRIAVYAASVSESFCSGLVGVAFVSYLMRITEKEHAAVQYALLTALYALSGTLAGAVSGLLVTRLGYASFFALTALFALPAFAFLRGACAWLGEPATTDQP